jgi:hypothetical protein
MLTKVTDRPSSLVLPLTHYLHSLRAPECLLKGVHKNGPDIGPHEWFSLK